MPNFAEIFTKIVKYVQYSRDFDENSALFGQFFATLPKVRQTASVNDRNKVCLLYFCPSQPNPEWQPQNPKNTAVQRRQCYYLRGTGQTWVGKSYKLDDYTNKGIITAYDTWLHPILNAQFTRPHGGKMLPVGYGDGAAKKYLTNGVLFRSAWNASIINNYFNNYFDLDR